MRGRRAVGEGWQATGWGSAPPPLSWCPPGFLSRSLPSAPDPEWAELEEEEEEEEEAGPEREVAGARDWEDATRTRVEVGFRRSTAPFVAAPLMGTGACRPDARCGG